VVTVLAIVLLAGLIFFVMNVGDQVNRRVAVQNATDSAAMGAAVQMARAMNTLAANNIAMGRLLAMVPVVDSQPVHVEVSLIQANAFLLAVGEQLARGFGPAGPLQGATAQAFANIQVELQRERAILEKVNSELSQFDVVAKTTYSVDGEYGAFWAAARDLDNFSRATSASAGLSAQTNAGSYARLSQAEAGFAAPIAPALLAVRGQWRHWYRAPEYRDTLLVHGWIPDLGFGPKMKFWVYGIEPYSRSEIEALLVRSGPFAKLFRWRDVIHEGDLSAPNTEFEFHGESGFGSHPVRPAGSAAEDDRPILGYSTYGPVTWMRRKVHSYWRSNLQYAVVQHARSYSGMGGVFDDLVNAKLRYMFTDGPVVAPETFHYPAWEVDYPEARRRIELGERVELTAYFRIEIVGPYGPGEPAFAEMIQDPSHSNVQDPLLLLQPSWRDRGSEEEQARVGLTLKVRVRPISAPPLIPSEFDIRVPVYISKPWGIMTGGYFWDAKFSPAEFLAKIEGMKNTTIRSIIRKQFAFLFPAILFPEGMPEFEFDVECDPPWVILRDIFVGADFGGERPIRNPANFASSEPADLPAPYLLDTRVGDYDVNGPHHDDDEYRREHFSYLGVARRSATATAWADRFGTDNPIGEIVAVAQAEVYNPTSWDLWTQDWRAQLVPVTGIGNWAMRMNEAIGDGEAVAAGVNADDLEQIARYLGLFEASATEGEQAGLIAGQAKVNLIQH